VAVRSERRIDWRVAVQGALLALAVALPPAIVVRLLKGDDLTGKESNLWVVTVLAIFAGFALGGYTAARRRPRTGLEHAAAAAGLAFGGIALYSILRHLVTGEGLDVRFLVQLVLDGTITVSIGVVAGWVAVRRS
jgi:predicted permease